MVDNLTPEQRSHCMSRVRSKNTALEKRVISALRKRGLRFKRYAKDLPGKPDIFFTRHKLAVFIDGDFWHGHRFPLWSRRMSPFWRRKIEKNRQRDKRNFAKLRRMGWKVVRIWQHQIKKDVDSCIGRILLTLNASRVPVVTAKARVRAPRRP
jgi:DNA mismatch endonuclease (patch repair protein)